MNKKGQISGILSILFGIIVSGVLLFAFSPTLNDFRVDMLDEYTTDYPTGKALEKLVLFSLMPLLWFAWILLSGIALLSVVNATRGTV